MDTDLSARLDRMLAALPRLFPGPGGAAAVLRRGEVLARHAWGYANAERRIPFTPRTLFRMCSVTKQFTCAAVLEACPDPEALAGAVRARLPRLEATPPSVLHLCHNQSGLRDYWAVAMLHGAPAESAFGDAETAQVVGGTRSLHFAPGTRFSYVNQNFRLLSDALEDHTGRSFGEHLARIFDRTGMETAFLAADTRAMPDGTEGYEGTQAGGFRAAENRLIWTGDAGLGASLDDMIAWERHIDASRDDPGSIYARLSAPIGFACGAPASYGFGLNRGTEFGRALTGHGGALRGWRSHRLHVASERVSVVVLFNHLSDAHAAALDLLGAVLGEARPAAREDLPAPTWLGTYVEPETGLSARVEAAGPGRVRLRYGQGPERLDLQADGGATNGRTRLVPTPEGLRMERPQDNQAGLLRPADGEARPDIAGLYRCAELDAELLVADAGGVAYGGFSGRLGQGRMELLEPAGPDVWHLPMPRALDHSPPGDWTIAFRRDAAGRVAGAQVGCWLARRLPYERIA
jgi:D-aminopeptidase